MQNRRVHFKIRCHFLKWTCPFPAQALPQANGVPPAGIVHKYTGYGVIIVGRSSCGRILLDAYIATFSIFVANKN
jgi:hypothetical protein